MCYVVLSIVVCLIAVVYNELDALKHYLKRKNDSACISSKEKMFLMSIAKMSRFSSLTKVISLPRDAKTVTLGTELSVRTSHSCQILIILQIV